MDDKKIIQKVHKDHSSRLILLVSIASIFVGFAFWLTIISRFPDSSITLRPLAILSLIGVLTNLGLMIFLFKRIQLTEVGFWFLAFLGTLASWSFTELMQRITDDPSVAIAWRLPAIFSWVIMPIMYLFFVLSYVDKQHLIRRLYFQVGIFLVVTGTIYAQFTTNLVLSSHYILKPWGYDSENGPYLNIFSLWLAILFLAALYLFIQDYKQTVSANRRKQIQIFLFGVSFPLVGGLFTDIILPFFGYDILPMAAFLTSLQGMVICYGIYKHGMFSINPIILSGEIMKTLPQPVIVTDYNFDIQFMNTNADEMFIAYKPFFGKNIKEIFGDENYKNIKGLIENSSAGEVVDIDKILLGIKGSVVIAQAKVRHVPESGGYIFGLSNITQQVLSMRVIEREVKNRTILYNQERARLMASVNGLQQGFLIIDGRKKISLMNKKAQKLFPSVRVSSLQSGHVVDGSEVVHLDKFLGDFGLDKKIDEVIKKNAYELFKEVEFGGAILDIEITPIVVEEDAIGVVVLLDDVTEATLIERSKDEFFSIASHELRTPLTAIRGNTSMIMEYYKDRIEGNELEEMISDIHESSRRLIEIVNDFLDTSRLEQGRMDFNLQKVDLKEIVSSVVKETSMVAKQQGDDIAFDPAIESLPNVLVDPDKLKQILYNLIGNSIKFTNKGKIRISALVEGNNVRVSVLDQGRGIKPESRKLLFRRFQQASSSLLTRDTTKGTGLGLYISKMILESMNGTIRLDSSELGKGSVFSFTIPIYSSEGEKKDVSKKSLPIDEKTSV